jgi:hypothetical protein
MSNTDDVDALQHELGTIDTKWRISEFIYCVAYYKLRTNERTYCYKVILFYEYLSLTSLRLLRLHTGIPMYVLITTCNYDTVSLYFLHK